MDGLLGQAAERLLRSLGFGRHGRHRTKPVELWQQGGARVLVNHTGPAVFFCRRRELPGPDWLGDFESRPAREPTDPNGPDELAGPAMITGIDHVALANPDDSFDEATLFYQSLLGMRTQGSEEVASPYGLVRSRPMRAPAAASGSCSTSRRAARARRAV